MTRAQAAMSQPPDPFEFLKRLWAPLGMPVPGAMPGMMFPTTSVEELDKRILELRAVEGWLSMNIEMLRATVQGLEAQKATLTTFESMQASATRAAEAARAAVAPEPVAKSRRRKG